MCNIFLRNLCFASCPQCATVRKNFNSKMTKMNGNGLNMVFKMIKLTSKAVFYHLYQNILPLLTINWPFFSKWTKKTYFLSKISSIYFFGAMSPMCNTFLGSLGVAHWVHPVYDSYHIEKSYVPYVMVWKISQLWSQLHRREITTALGNIKI